MLDYNVNLEFSPNLTFHSKSQIDQLVITSCALHYCGSDKRIISDFEDLCYNTLNGYNQGFGFLDIEVGLTGYTGEPYPKVYTKCFLLFADTYLYIKPRKLTNEKSESKVNQRGETVIGFRYYFCSEEEVQKLGSAERLMFDSFFALEKPTNTYALACQLKRNGNEWTAVYANTYRRKEKENIKGLID